MTALVGYLGIPFTVGDWVFFIGSPIVRQDNKRYTRMMVSYKIMNLDSEFEGNRAIFVDSMLGDGGKGPIPMSQFSDWLCVPDSIVSQGREVLTLHLALLDIELSPPMDKLMGYDSNAEMS